MSGVVLRRLSGAELLARQEDARRVYAEAFTGPPWAEDDSAADRFVLRLTGDALRDGFTAAGTFRDGRLIGLATAWTTPAPFPSGRCYPQAQAALGADRTAEWLCGGREVDELALATAARGQGVGAALLDAVTADAPGGRCWLLTSVRARNANAIYRRLGWTPATHPAPEGSGIVVFSAQLIRRALPSPARSDPPKYYLCVPPTSASVSWTTSPNGATPSSPARRCPPRTRRCCSSTRAWSPSSHT
ncbi:hypothetical protein GCM10009647_074270 [Streptomyces sanglieri]|uniref:GNAT family N-acetyltransferase n=1 Tax=Streptomyces sanglieri TaxID=193460 RepID=A0ABW2X5B7_9ACTN|nr:GNAT family N-acetyltransferase [Streptomyces sp. Wh19]MDV9194833.1 GNAT family N-acetyltransferase [Streptomyces sp. Wh19]